MGDFDADGLLTDGGQWCDRRLRWREDLRAGLRDAPAACSGFLEAEDLGELPFRVAPAPTP